MKRSCVLLLLLASVALAQHAVPPVISYQGRITDDAGDGIHGTRKLAFRIYDQAVGGTLIWGAQTFNPVVVVDGHYNVLLGSTDSIGRPILDAFAATNRWLEVAVNDVVQTPRQAILSAPFAVQADNSRLLAGHDWTGILADGSNNPDTGQLNGARLKNGTVSSAQIADNQIDTDHIINGQVTADDIGPNAVGESEIASGAVRTDEILNETITADDIGPNAVGESEIASGAVRTDEILNGQVMSIDIADGTITDTDLANPLTISGTITAPSGNVQLNGKGAICWQDSGLVKIAVVTHTITTGNLSIGSGSQVQQTVDFGAGTFSGQPYAVWIGSHTTAWIGWKVTGEMAVATRPGDPRYADFSIYRESTPVTIVGPSTIQILAIGPR